MEIVKREYSFRRMRNIFFLSLAKNLPVTMLLRAKLYKWGGLSMKPGIPQRIGKISVDTLHPEDIIIEEGCVITNGCILLSHFLLVYSYLSDTDSEYHFKRGKILIGKKAYLGSNVIITSPVTIGEGAIVGAGSIVTKDIPAYEVWGGNPAKFIKRRISKDL